MHHEGEIGIAECGYLRAWMLCTVGAIHKVVVQSLLSLGTVCQENPPMRGLEIEWASLQFEKRKGVTKRSGE
jgi:hypothetical protein